MSNEPKPLVVRVPRKIKAPPVKPAVQVQVHAGRINPPFSVAVSDPYESIYQGARPPDNAEMHLYTTSSQSLSLRNLYRGSHGFIILSGPSLNMHDLSLLSETRGIVTMGVNNSWSVFKPNLWICLDEPHYFLDMCWKDPSIMKFVPFVFSNKNIGIKDENGKFSKSPLWVNNLPSVLYFKRNLRFRVKEFLTEPTVNWGVDDNDSDELGLTGGRNIILAAVKMMYYLGFRTIYLLGADFKMEEGKPTHAFSQHKNLKNIPGHNASFDTINKRFVAMLPEFELAGLRVFNCYEDSGLTAFPYMSYAEAIHVASKEFQKPLDVAGWADQYETEQSAKVKSAETSKKLLPRRK